MSYSIKQLQIILNNYKLRGTCISSYQGDKNKQNTTTGEIFFLPPLNGSSNTWKTVMKTKMHSPLLIHFAGKYKMPEQ